PCFCNSPHRLDRDLALLRDVLWGAVGSVSVARNLLYSREPAAAILLRQVPAYIISKLISTACVRLACTWKLELVECRLLVTPKTLYKPKNLSFPICIVPLVHSATC
ncbi:hypothetical protein SARC_01523, partial [Sphaeroforma arctica JP610]